jgi:hypothetical protein
MTGLAVATDVPWSADLPECEKARVTSLDMYLSCLIYGLTQAISATVLVVSARSTPSRTAEPNRAGRQDRRSRPSDRI